MQGAEAITSRAYKAAHPASSGTLVAWMFSAARMLGGMQRLADVMGIQSRSLRAKMEFSRGIKPADLLKVADALDAQAIRTAEHAARLRREAAGNDA